MENANELCEAAQRAWAEHLQARVVADEAGKVSHDANVAMNESFERWREARKALMQAVTGESDPF